MTEFFELHFRYRFEAAHRFSLSHHSQCSTPHGHTWYVDLSFAQAAGSAVVSAPLSADMVVEFGKIKSIWKSFITEVVDHSYLHHAADPILPSLREHIASFRGLGFPGDPTTELVSALFFAKAWAIHRASALGAPEASADLGRVVPIALSLRETPTNKICFRAPGPLNIFTPLEDHAHFTWLKELNQKWQGWWQQADPNSRLLTPL